MAKKAEFIISIRDSVSIGGIKGVIGALEKGIARSKAFGDALRRGFHSAPVQMLRNALAGLVGTLAAGVMQSAKFNIEMARAWTMTQQGIGWFKEMRGEIRSMSAEFGIAKEQLSGGLYQALSAGVPEGNVLEFLSTAAKVAVADGSDVATAVDGISTVLNAFKIDAADTEAVADQLFNTVANGKTTFSDLAQNLATVAPIAAANGVALNEVLAAIATLTKQGTPTAQAMTQIRAAIIGANKALGDGWAKSNSLQEAFGKIEEASKGSQTELMKLVGSIEAVQGVLGLTGINATMAANDLASTANAAGKVDQAFRKVDQFRHWNKLWQSISGLVTKTAEEADSRLAPAIMEMVDGIMKIQGNDALFQGLGDTLDEATEKVAKIFEYIQTGGGTAAREVVDALGLILMGHAKNGAQEAAAILAKWIPILGYEFGRAAIKATTESFTKTADVSAEANRRATQTLKEEGLRPGAGKAYGDRRRDLVEYYKKEVSDEIVRQQQDERGSALSRTVGSRMGDLDKELGYGKLDRIFANVDESRKQREGENQSIVAKRVDNQSSFSGKEALINTAGVGYGRLQERIATGKNSVVQEALHGTKESLESAQASLQTDQALATQIYSLAGRIKNGLDGGPTQMAIQLLQQLIQQQNTQSDQIKQLQSQIRCGRS